MNHAMVGATKLGDVVVRLHSIDGLKWPDMPRAVNP